MIGAISFFGASLLGIIMLLMFKAWEMRRDSIIAPRVRGHLDRGALVLKSWIERGEDALAQLPTFVSFLVMRSLASVSMHLARLARHMSESAYRLADFISHKHNFERRETRSEFLKTMIEHKNGLAQPISNVVKKRKPRKTTKPSNSTDVVSEMQS